MKTVTAGEWIRVPYDAGARPVFMGLSSSVSDKPEEWVPAFVDGGDACFRAPDLPGSWYPWAKGGDEAVRGDAIRIGR